MLWQPGGELEQNIEDEFFIVRDEKQAAQLLQGSGAVARKNGLFQSRHRNNQAQIFRANLQDFAVPRASSDGSATRNGKHHQRQAGALRTQTHQRFGRLTQQQRMAVDAAGGRRPRGDEEQRLEDFEGRVGGVSVTAEVVDGPRHFGLQGHTSAFWTGPRVGAGRFSQHTTATADSTEINYASASC